MCGIVGVAAQRPIASRAWLTAGRDAMRHRGPDDAGEYWSDDGRVGFGHRRLAVVDLSPLAHQPMSSADGTVWITYNGEVYNHLEVRTTLEQHGHSFRSTSDTEVVLAAYLQWGAGFLTRIDGMFALAIHDARQNKILLARDRAGEKPLFYRLQNGELRFASELKGLLQDPSFERHIDPEALDCYLAMGYVPGERCILAGVSKLRAAYALSFDCSTGNAKVWPYWALPEFAGPDEPSADEDLLDELEQLLGEAVARQMVADVQVGLLLSGGVDSSLITALAVRSAPGLKTYTVGFRQFQDYDETAHASLVADYFGTDHTLLEADEVGPEILPRLASQYDEPLNDSSMIPTFLVTQQIRRHCTVALGGDGGDELFGGYHSASRVAQLQQILQRAPRWPLRVISGAATRLMPIGMKGRAGLRMIGTDMSRELPPIATHFDGHHRRRLLGDPAWPLVASEIRAREIPATPDAVQRMTRFDFRNYMAEDILMKVDRASMLNSLEVRSPFLDRKVVEFAFARVPSRLKATPDKRKIILRKLASRLLPQRFDSARKQGFGIPLGHWLSSGPWRNHFEEVLFDPSSLFNRAEVERLYRSLDRGRPVKEQLFGLALFEHWRRTYGLELPGHAHASGCRGAG